MRHAVLLASLLFTLSAPVFSESEAGTIKISRGDANYGRDTTGEYESREKVVITNIVFKVVCLDTTNNLLLREPVVGEKR